MSQTLCLKVCIVQPGAVSMGLLKEFIMRVENNVARGVMFLPQVFKARTALSDIRCFSYFAPELAVHRRLVSILVLLVGCHL